MQPIGSNKMKNKLFYIGIIALFSAGFFCIGWYVNKSTQTLTIDESGTVRIKVDEPETIRLSKEGPELKILTSTNSTVRNFIFLNNKTGDIISTLSLANMNIEAPYYRIINGDWRDWFVVSTIAGSGTGFLRHLDDWYALDNSGQIKKVLSYLSDGHEVPLVDGMKNYFYYTEILNQNNLEDTAVGIKFIEKICTDITEDGEGKNCKESSRIDHYVWDASKEEFALK